MYAFLKWLFSPIEFVLGKYVQIDDWYRLGVGTSVGGASLSSFFKPELVFASASNGFIGEILSNPVAWATALCILVINVISAVHKFAENKREEEKHDQEMKHRDELHQKNLNDTSDLNK